VRPRLLHVFSTLAVGGPQVRTADLVSGFGAAFEHVFVAVDGRTDALDRLRFAAPVRRRALAFAKGRGLAAGNLRRVVRLIAEERPDLLLTYNFGALEAALANRLWCGLPHLHFEDGFGPEESPARQLRRRVWLRRLALGGRAQVVVPSRTLERVALETWKLPRPRVHHVPNGIDLARFTTLPRPEAAPDRPVRIGAVGALRAEKNLARLLRAAAEVARTRALEVHLAGDGPERAGLEALAGELGLDVRFHGHLAAPETLLAALDLYALSSDTEQMPYGLLEAMAAGLPVVATDVGDVRSLLPPESRGFVVPPGADAALAERLGALVDDPALRRARGDDHARWAARHFARATMFEAYAGLFAALLHRPVRAGPELATAADTVARVGPSEAVEP
jgi:glycosyltransferase involved in cell wall biosynthesis